MKMDFSTVFVYISALNLLLISVVLSHSDNTLVLIVSFDGFRHDYLQKVAKSGRKTPNFDKLRQEGVEAQDVKNRFITKTFPNHYSIVTGYHEENHGVTANEFYDESTGRKFNFSDDSDSTMWNNGTKGGGAEPVWVTNEKAEHSALFKKRSGCMMWPGCKAEIHGVRPTWSMAYNKTYPNKSRIDDVIKWFSSEDKPINLGLLYFSEPDHSGHEFGPESEKILDLIVALDEVVGYLLSELEKHHLLHKMNLIITSDHGMAEVDKVIELDQYLNSSWYTKYGGSPVYNIEPEPGKLEEVYDALKKIPHLNTYKKDEIPREYYYTWNNRIQPIVITAELGYNIVQSGGNPNRGNHGYNNSLSDMHPFFIAHGPAFKKNYKAKPFNNIDIYPLMCHILDISPYPNNGSLENIYHILYNNETEGFLIFNMTILTFLLSVGFAALVSGIFCISAFRSYRILLRRKRPMVVRLNNIHDGHTHLLSNTDEDEEEEIP